MSSSDEPAAGADTSTLDQDTLSVKTDSEAGQTTLNEQNGFDGTSALERETPLAGRREVRDVHVEAGEDGWRTIGTVGGAVDAWRDYLVARENDVIALRKLDEAKDGENQGEEVLAMPYQHRWKQSYRKKSYAKLKAVEEAVEAKYGENVPTTMLTLTAGQTDENGNPRPPLEVMEEMADAWESLRKSLHHALEGFDTEYVRIWEPHESGYPHLHVAIFGVALPSLENVVERLWAEKYDMGSKKAQSAEIQNGRAAQMESAAAYLMKYVGKGLIRDSDTVEDGDSAAESVENRLPATAGYQVFSSLLWISGTRQFSMSQGLSEMISIEDDDDDDEAEWEFIGIVNGIESGYYRGSRASQLLEHLESSQYVPAPSLDTTEQAALDDDPPPSAPAD